MLANIYLHLHLHLHSLGHLLKLQNQYEVDIHGKIITLNSLKQINDAADALTFDSTSMGSRLCLCLSHRGLTVTATGNRR